MIEKDRKNVQKCQGSAASVRAHLPTSLKSNQYLIHTILFIFERASRGYLEHLNRSSVEKVMAILRTLRSAVKIRRKLAEIEERKEIVAL